MPRLIDLTGKTFGLLRVVRHAGKNSFNQHMWLAVCTCGKEKTYVGHTLRYGTTKSCGCRGGLADYHGLSNTRTYRIWELMWNRCTNSKTIGWDNYGGRGIGVDPKWKKFRNFYEDMGEAPEGLSLDRIDNDKGYSKSNCRWATRIEQANNKRTNRSVLLCGSKMSLKRLVLNLRLNYKTLHKKAMNKPLGLAELLG